jgi:predicted TIM-barrel fold metal-dependent hydrolase
VTIVDAHAHLEERTLDLPRMIAQLDARGIDRVVLIPCMNDPLPGTPVALLWLFRRLLCSPLHQAARPISDALMTPEGHLKLRGKLYQIYPRPDNALVARAIAAYPERFLGWIFLNPRASDGVEELERWRAVPGFVGLKLHPHWHRWAIEEALPLARRCEEVGLPILIHLGFGAGGRWQVLADACPRLRIVFAHAGMPHYARMWRAIAGDRRLFVDCSSPYLDERLVREAIAALGPERVLYGTDAPYGFHGPGQAYDYGVIKGWVERAPVRAAAIDRMLGGNVLELLGDRR